MTKESFKMVELVYALVENYVSKLIENQYDIVDLICCFGHVDLDIYEDTSVVA